MNRRQRLGLALPAALAVAALLLAAVPAQGQSSDNNVLGALFNGLTATATPAATPAATPTVISTTTPTTTPATPTATPAATPAATTAAAATTTAAATTAAAAAAPEAETPVITPLARRPPAPVRRTLAPPPPPAPIVIDPAKLVPALPAAQTLLNSTNVKAAPGSGSVSPGVTAVDVVIRVAGPGVTPFVIPQQTVLLRAMASVLTSVSLRDLQIRYVTSSANSRRRLHEAADQGPRRHLAAAPNDASAAAAAAGQLYNVASVTLQANCSDSNAVPTTLAEIQSVLANNLLVSAIASYGQPDWGISLMSITAVNPNLPLNTGADCEHKFGAFCLDGSGLTTVAVEVIIAVGAIVLVMLVAIPWVLLEWRRKSGMMADLEPTPQTPHTPFARVQQMYNKLVNTVKAASPMHRAGNRGAFNRSGETPVSAKSGGGAVQMTASSTR